MLVRGQKVTLDTDLDELYRIPTKALNQAMKRNKEVPGDSCSNLQIFADSAYAFRNTVVCCLRLQDLCGFFDRDEEELGSEQGCISTRSPTRFCATGESDAR